MALFAWTRCSAAPPRTARAWTTTPHTLRRTYISVALVANNFDVKWVMDQVGHSDSTMTMDVYAQLQQRMDRQHGASFDRLVRRAKKQLAGVATAA